MGKIVEFFIDLGNPSSYLAWTQSRASAKKLAKRCNTNQCCSVVSTRQPAALRRQPLQSKADTSGKTTSAIAKRYDIRQGMNPHFPIITLFLMRAAAGVQLRDKPRAFQCTPHAGTQRTADRRTNLNMPELTASVLRGRDFKANEIKTGE
jgi:2-hydroxychromene-2-carboxylate isomerase